MPYCIDIARPQVTPVWLQDGLCSVAATPCLRSGGTDCAAAAAPPSSCSAGGPAGGKYNATALHARATAWHVERRSVTPWAPLVGLMGGICSLTSLVFGASVRQARLWCPRTSGLRGVIRVRAAAAGMCAAAAVLWGAPRIRRVLGGP